MLQKGILLRVCLKGKSLTVNTEWLFEDTVNGRLIEDNLDSVPDSREDKMSNSQIVSDLSLQMLPRHPADAVVQV